MIKETSEVMFSLSFGTKLYNNDLKNFFYIPIEVRSNIFSFECQPNRQSEKKILERKYKFKIEPILGFLMFRNIALRNYDWIPERVYDLSKNSQIIFRRFISHRRGISKVTKISLADLKSHIHYYKDYSQVKSIAIESLKEMKNNELIEDFKVIGTRSWSTYFIVTNIKNGK